MPHVDLVPCMCHTVVLTWQNKYALWQIVAPKDGDLSDGASRHFMSVLSHIESAAGEAGTTVTIHDASKPAHVRFPLGVLVGQARRAQSGHSSARGGRHAAINANGGPATTNMVRKAYAFPGPAKHFACPSFVLWVLLRHVSPLQAPRLATSSEHCRLLLEP